jgi:hypothetical protein
MNLSFIMQSIIIGIVYSQAQDALRQDWLPIIVLSGIINAQKLLSLVGVQELIDGLQTERDSFNLGLYAPGKSYPNQTHLKAC